MKRILERMALLLALLLALIVWGKPTMSGAEETTAKSKLSEESVIKLQDGGTLGKTRITSAAFFEEDQYALSDLTEEAKRIIQEFTERILSAKADYAERYAGLSIVLTITTTCYAEPRLSTRRAETINAYLRQLLSEHDQADLKLTIKYTIGKGPEEISEKMQGATETDSDAHKELSPRTYDISAELKIKERGPRVSHPSEIILYEVIEE